MHLIDGDFEVLESENERTTSISCLFLLEYMLTVPKETKSRGSRTPFLFMYSTRYSKCTLFFMLGKFNVWGTQMVYKSW